MATYTIGPVSCTATDPGTGLHEFSGRVVLTTTTDAANNATIINTWRFEIYITRQAYVSHYSYQNNNRCTVVINGQTLVSTGNIKAVTMEGHYESGNPGPFVLCSGSNITVPHNSDGTKSLAVSANYTQTGSGNYIGTIAPSGTVTLETIVRADVISTAPALTLAGSGTTNHTVSWTNSGSFYHSIEYKYGNTTLTTQNVSGTSATSYTYAVPASWASNVTNAKTMTVTAVLHSYSDSGRTNELGSNSKTFVVTFADSFAPTFGTATLVQNDRLSTTVVAGKSYTKVTVTPSYKNSATYKSGWAVYMDGTKELGSRKTGNPADGITLDKIPAFTATSKSLTIKYSVTDSRGFTATGTSSAFTAYGWAAPSITSLSAVRCNSGGTADLSGSNFKATLTYSIRALNNANAKTIQVKYRWNSQSTFTTAATATPTSYSGTLTLGPYGLSNTQDDKLIVRVEVYDSLSTSNHTTADTTVLPASVFIDIKTSGDKKVGLAVGMINTKDNTVQLGWPLEVSNDARAVLDPVAGLTFYDEYGSITGQYPVDGNAGVEVDTTLSVQGMAADAKATGDAISSVHIDVDTSLSHSGEAADSKAVGDALTTIRAQVGAPLVASTSSAMTDQTRIYVYTGSQSGYVNGNWYYWNGSAWTSGGVYNSVAVQTDTSLSVSGQAADAKAAGDKLNFLDLGLGRYIENDDITYLADITGSYINTSGNIASSGAYRMSDYIELPANAVSIKSGNKFVQGSTTYHFNTVCTFYNSSKTKISHVRDTTNDYATADVPSGAKYIRINQANDASPNISGIVNGFWIYTDAYADIDSKWNVLTVAENPNLNDNSVDFHELEPNKIYYRSSFGATPANEPYPNFFGTVVVIRAISIDTGKYVFAISGAMNNGIYYCRSTGTPPDVTWTDWVRIPNSMNFSQFIGDALGAAGTYTFTFTETQEIKYSNIILGADKKYLVRFMGERSGRIRLFPKGDSTYYAQLQPYQNEIVVWNNTNEDKQLSAYNIDRDAGSFIATVSEIGSIDAKIGDVPTKYTVAKDSHDADFTSVTACFLALKDDPSPKVVEIWEGDYDIYQEYRDAGVPVNTSDDPIADFPPYCVFIPQNTHVIGKGIVRLKWMPTKSTNPEITWRQTRAVSPVNVMGSMTLENVEIHCKNGRYCIHNDTIGLAPYAGSYQKYINVKCYKYENETDTTTTPSDPTSFGTNHVVGFGMSKDQCHIWESCFFKNYANGRAFYGHSNLRYNGVEITQQESGEIIMNNCIMDTTYNPCVKFGNVGSTRRQIQVRFNDCYFSGRVEASNESDGTGSLPNSFDMTFLNCGDVNVKIPESGNAYPPKGYRTNITMV